MATGLLDRMRIFSGSAVAVLGIRDWKYSAPIFIGDTIYLQLRIDDVRASRSKPDCGVVERELTITNQRGDIVQHGHIDVLVRRRLTAAT
jgi:acyl dehydratase